MEEYSFEVRNILRNAEKEMLELKHPYVGTEHLLLSLLKEEKVKNVVSKYNLTYSKFKKQLKNIVGSSSKMSEIILYTPLLRLVLDNVESMKNKNSVTSIDLLKSLISSDDGIAIRILMTMGIDINDLYNDLLEEESDVLSSLGICLNDTVTDNLLIGRDKELENIIEILLRKNKNNPILVGPSGVGKSAIVYELAKRIKNNQVPDKLKGMKIISVDMASLLANTKYRGEFETKINNMIKEIKNNKNIILFIDEVHTIIKSGGGEGSIDAGNMLKPYLATNDIKLIGCTTTEEYEKFIAQDHALERRMSKVYISEPTKEDTLNILKNIKDIYSEYYNIEIKDEVINNIVELSDKYITNNHNPDKSIEVLDSLLSKINIKRSMIDYDYEYNEFLKNKNYKSALKYRKSINDIDITDEDIIKVIEELTNVKILTSDNYKTLYKDLKSKIYGQDVDKLYSILESKLKLGKCFNIEIRGCDNIGKSYTAKIISESLNYNFLELDMEEYQSPTSINKLIGADPGYIGYNETSILNTIKYNPSTVILLKNIQYASLNILDLFTSIAKKSYMIDKKNNKINFNNVIIIMTSNKESYELGYNKENNKSDNIINYNLIDKNAIKEYLINNNYSLDILNKVDNKTNFLYLHHLLDELLTSN